MAGEWRCSTWGEEISLEYGKALRGYEAATGEYRVFGSNGPIGWTTEFLARGPGVILGRKGAYRGVQYSQDPFYVIDTAYYVAPKTNLDMRWLYYAIQHYKLGEVDDGSPIPSTTRAAVYVRDLDVPPSDEQRAIAHILCTLDDKIELNRRMNETLEAMARALFKSWFVNFDPVRAKAEGRDPGLPQPLADLFPDSFEDSEPGEIPNGWTVGKIRDNCEQIQNGGTPRRDDPRYWDGGAIPWLGSGEVRQPVITVTENFITQAGLEESSAKWVPSHSSVVALYGATAGQVSIVSLPLTTNQAVCALIPRKNCAMFNYLTMRKATRELESKAVGSAQQNISKGIVEETRIVVPPMAVICQFSAIADSLLDRWIANLYQSRTLAALRDTLLPKLISGELRVSADKGT
jgi:type I restriction enzyme, S subunit